MACLGDWVHMMVFLAKGNVEVEPWKPCGNVANSLLSFLDFCSEGTMLVPCNVPLVLACRMQLLHAHAKLLVGSASVFVLLLSSLGSCYVGLSVAGRVELINWGLGINACFG
jgi:hypothetical protein